MNWYWKIKMVVTDTKYYGKILQSTESQQIVLKVWNIVSCMFIVWYSHGISVFFNTFQYLFYMVCVNIFWSLNTDLPIDRYPLSSFYENWNCPKISTWISIVIAKSILDFFCIRFDIIQSFSTKLILNWLQRSIVCCAPWLFQTVIINKGSSSHKKHYCSKKWYKLRWKYNYSRS